jgi:hypothetical protein
MPHPANRARNFLFDRARNEIDMVPLMARTRSAPMSVLPLHSEHELTLLGHRGIDALTHSGPQWRYVDVRDLKSVEGNLVRIELTTAPLPRETVAIH